jgi:dTDP-4-amino-4,6-dideoxygalactose transaminase
MIPFIDLKAQYHSIKDEIDDAIKNVLESCQFALGEEVFNFEAEFASECGSSHAIAVNSGTSALHLALLAAGIGPGDEVITVPYTFVGTIAAICYTGAYPVLVDIEPRSYTIAVDQIEKAITDKTKAILPVHLYGQAADMDPIMEIAKRHHLVVIEDACQAYGAEYKGKRVGGIGDLACFSFYPGKNLGAYGEGGITLTNNAAYARTIRMLRQWGQEERYVHLLRGFNYRMDGIQGAVLRVKLKHIEAWTEARRRCAQKYNDLLSETNLVTPIETENNRHVYYLYTVRVSNREALSKALKAENIEALIHYPIPVHLQPAYLDLGYTAGAFPCSEEVAKEVISLPLYPEMKDSALQTVSDVIIKSVYQTIH